MVNMNSFSCLLVRTGTVLQMCFHCFHCVLDIGVTAGLTTGYLSVPFPT